MIVRLSEPLRLLEFADRLLNISDLLHVDRSPGIVVIGEYTECGDELV